MKGRPPPRRQRERGALRRVSDRPESLWGSVSRLRRDGAWRQRRTEEPRTPPVPSLRPSDRRFRQRHPAGRGGVEDEAYDAPSTLHPRRCKWSASGGRRSCGVGFTHRRLDRFLSKPGCLRQGVMSLRRGRSVQALFAAFRSGGVRPRAAIAGPRIPRSLRPCVRKTQTGPLASLPRAP